jgi:hypothetical protein
MFITACAWIAVCVFDSLEFLTLAKERAFFFELHVTEHAVPRPDSLSTHLGRVKNSTPQTTHFLGSNFLLCSMFQTFKLYMEYSNHPNRYLYENKPAGEPSKELRLAATSRSTTPAS